MMIRILSLLALIIVVIGTTNAARASCQLVLSDLTKFVAENPSRVIAFQATHNKTRGSSGTISISEGYLTSFSPDRQKDIADLIGTVRSGLFQPLNKFVLDDFVFNDPSTNKDRRSSVSSARQDKIQVIMLESGEIYIVLTSWNNVVLSLKNAMCRQVQNRAYISGMTYEDNGTTMVSMVLQKIERLQ